MHIMKRPSLASLDAATQKRRAKKQARGLSTNAIHSEVKCLCSSCVAGRPDRAPVREYVVSDLRRHLMGR